MRSLKNLDSSKLSYQTDYSNNFLHMLLQLCTMCGYRNYGCCNICGVRERGVVRLAGRTHDIVGDIISRPQPGLEVIDEGVETAIHYDLVRKMGCNVVHGYLLGRTLSPTAFSDACCGEPSCEALWC